MTDTGDFQDPYIDPATGLLRNLVGALTKEALSDAEGDLAFARLVQLMDRPPAATGDLAELQAIHHPLFQDVYAWAGQIRTVDVRKNVEGAEFFLPVSMIGRASGFAADELHTENMFSGMSRSQFIERLSYHYEQFNYIHPFREGNGRTQRVFWNRIARDAGWQLDWRPVRGAVNDRASRVAAEQRDFGPLHDMFDQIVSQAPLPHERNDTWRAVERARMSFGRGCADDGRNDV
jgi:cell filamentation protein